MALVLAPDGEIADWLALLDAEIARAGALFIERPVVLDLGLLSEADPAGLDGLLHALDERGIRVIAAENVPAGVDGMPAPLAGARETGEIEIAEPAPPAPPPRSLVVDATVRSGQQIVHPEGDVTVLGSVASGAEVMAGGSIHVYGALRGRAVAGSGGNPAARIICRRLHAELLAIDGFYLTADDMDPAMVGGPVMAQLDGEQMTMSVLE
jgi:septum site-determining protein MinC